MSLPADFTSLKKAKNVLGAKKNHILRFKVLQSITKKLHFVSRKGRKEN